MSSGSLAGALGQRLLSDIKEEGLDELLRDLRTQFQPHTSNTSYLGVKEVDDLLNVFLNTHQVPPAAQGAARQGPESYFNNNNNRTAAHHQERNHRHTRKNPVIEITSPSSGSGKSQLIYYFIAISVLPSVFKGTKIGGRDGAVVVLDTDGRFDVKRVYGIARGIIRQSLRANSSTVDGDKKKKNDNNKKLATEISILIRDSLQHIHIFRPQTSTSLLSTLKSLDHDYLLNNNNNNNNSIISGRSKHRSSSRPLSALFLDSASAFYWADRLRDEVARTQEIGRNAAAIQQDRDERKTFHINILYQDIATELRRIQAVFECVVVYSTWGISRSVDANSRDNNRHYHSYAHSSSSRPPSFKPHLPFPWPTLPDLRLVVQRDPIPAFPATSASDTMVNVQIQCDAPIRQEVVKRGKFSAWVDTWGSEFWSPAIFNALKSMPDNSGFPFWVREDGVFMDDLMGDNDNDNDSIIW